MEYGLIGKNVTFSYSKYIHSLINDKEYNLCSFQKEEVIKLLQEKNFLGLNVTIPYKETVIPYLSTFPLLRYYLKIEESLENTSILSMCSLTFKTTHLILTAAQG